jgi:uncharacterized membrane protein
VSAFESASPRHYIDTGDVGRSLGNTNGVKKPQRTDRGFDRLVNFSDAVVAIAITLTILPLMELQTEKGAEGTWPLILENKLIFLAFIFTFLLTSLYWLIHHRVFEYIQTYDHTLAWLNMLWLLLIAFLPFLSAQVAEHQFTNGTGTIYCLVLAGLSIILGLIARHARTHPEMLVKGVDSRNLGTMRSWAMAAYLIVVAGVAVLWTDQAAYLMFASVLVSIGVRKVEDHRWQNEIGETVNANP